MKILLYTYDIMKIGGIETSFYNLSKYLESKGHNVGVRYSVIAPMQLKRYKEAGIDIQTQQPETCDILMIGSVWRRPTNIKSRLVVQQVHADWSDKFWGKKIDGIKLLRSADKECDVFAPVSSSAGGFVAKHTDKPIFIMNNIAPVKTEIKHKKNKKLVIAAFTRMSTEKGLKNYESLRDRLIELKIDADLRVYTNGDAPDGWRACEPVPDIRTELPSIDFVASLADTESFGYTIAEANSCGIPVIIKRSNSTGEFFDSQSNIIVDDIAEIDTKSLRRKISVDYRLRKKTEKSIDSTMKELEKLVSKKCIMKVMRSYIDLQVGNTRYPGELFTVSKERALELLKNENKIVEIA